MYFKTPEVFPNPVTETICILRRNSCQLSNYSVGGKANPGGCGRRVGSSIKLYPHNYVTLLTQIKSTLFDFSEHYEMFDSMP
jgi:hypothetical protein